MAANGGIHPNCGVADTRLLHRARLTAVPATRGGGLHPNREVWVREPARSRAIGLRAEEQASAGSGEGVLGLPTLTIATVIPGPAENPDRSYS